jgi:low temperature requirement protein LtrA
VDGHHMAERCSLFVIIALGESILVTGATAAAQPATMATMGAFVIAFLGSVAMWWIYFNIGAERGSHHIAHSDDPGRMARAVYTYFHIPIIAGIVVCAVADEITIAHPDGHVDLPHALVILLAILAPFALLFTPLVMGAATTAVLIVVAVWETRSFGSVPGGKSLSPRTPT